MQNLYAAHVHIKLNNIPQNIQQKVLDNLTLSLLAKEKIDLNDEQLQFYINEGKEEIDQSLQLYGYYRNIINSNIKKQNNDWFVTFNIKLTKQVRVSAIKIDIIGDKSKIFTSNKILQKSPLNKGDVFNQFKYKELKNYLLNIANEYGYFDVIWQAKNVNIYPQKYSANILLKLSTGSRYSFDKIQITADKPFAQKFLHSFMYGIHSHTFYDKNIIDILHKRLSTYFQSVHINEIKNKEKKKISLKIKVNAQKNYKYKMKIGYETENEFHFSTILERRNLGEYGHGIIFDGLINKHHYGISTHYNIPGTLPYRENTILNAQILQENPASTDELEQTSVLFGIKKSINNLSHSSNFEYGLNIQHDEYENIFADNIIRKTALMPFIYWRNKWETTLHNMLHSHNIIFKLEGSLELKNTSSSFVKLQISDRIITQFNTKQRLIIFTEAGQIFNNDIHEIPPNSRFLTGGNDNLRGYSYNSVGPQEISHDGEIKYIGGLKLINLSTEIEHNISEKLRLAIFFDAGNAMDSWHNPLKKDIGLGLRRHFIFGTLFIDAAHPMDEPRRLFRISVHFKSD